MFNFNDFINERKNRVRVSQIIDNDTLRSQAGGAAYGAMQRHMRACLSDFIATEKVREIKEEYTTRYEIDLLVFTPDEFAGLLRQAAMDYAMSPAVMYPSVGKSGGG
jgi:hypothetical protein